MNNDLYRFCAVVIGINEITSPRQKMFLIFNRSISSRADSNGSRFEWVSEINASFMRKQFN